MVGVALEGGGARGSYQVGALKALKKCGIKPKCFVGTSIGSVNAALSALGDIKKMEDIWYSVSCEEILNIDTNLIKAVNDKKINRKMLKEGFKTITGIIKNSGIDTTNLKKVYKQYINEEELRNSNCDFGLVTYSLSDKKPVELFLSEIPKGKLHEYLIASCYLPIFKMEKIIDDKYYIDGGVHDNCPINLLLKAGYDEIYAIRTYSIGVTQKLIKNDAKITYIGPSKPLGSLLLFDENKIRENVNMGFYDTLKVIKKLDGNNYYFKRKSKDYYEKITENLNDLELFMIDSITRDKKKMTIKVIEKLLKEFNMEVYKLYNIPLVLIKLKFLLKNKPDHKYYNFIKKIKIMF